ncbi:hypothetical protein CVT25_007974 [Psilocybe cyanescens]|uniref:Uncharacterized protein n=1 Tax=Psilocybe cyanescens TaxID=93625 RepID=A0A409XMZ0_PSICY|nr:hypothetical protein CVT25_007974 [Psilocybe cyanescens]
MDVRVPTQQRVQNRAISQLDIILIQQHPILFHLTDLNPISHHVPNPDSAASKTLHPAIEHIKVNENALIFPILKAIRTMKQAAPPNSGEEPLDWSALHFHPLGLFDLRRQLGSLTASIFNTFCAHFDSADLAWFVAGLASQPANIKANEFYPELHTLRNNMADQNGTDTRLALCCPFGLRFWWNNHVREDKRYTEAVSSIVQMFITEIGIPNIVHYERCATLHWKLPQGNHIPPALPQQSSQPYATPPGSSVFTYYGQPKPHVVVIDDDDDDFVTMSQDQLITYIKNEHILKDDLKSACQRLQEVEQTLSGLQCHENALSAKVNRLANALAMHSRSATPLVLRTTPCTPD